MHTKGFNQIYNAKKIIFGLIFCLIAFKSYAIEPTVYKIVYYSILQKVKKLE